MAIKDRLVSWFLRNIVIPKIDIWNKPGFVVTQFTEKGKIVFLREFFLPEPILVEFEKTISKKYNKKGEQILYSIGKKFTYVFSKLSKFPNIKTSTVKELFNFADRFIHYVECTYAARLSYSIDLKSKMFNLKAKNYVVCPKNGLGYILGAGLAGIWSYVMADPSIEGIQIKCEGRKDEFCEMIFAPKDTLLKMKMSFFIENDPDIKDIQGDDIYKRFNRFQNTKFATKSLKDMIDSKLFMLSGGLLIFGGVRYIYIDSSLIYILEKEIQKLKGANKILKNIAFKWGKIIAKQANSVNFITEYFSAIGLGDTLVAKKGDEYDIIINYFPWTALWKDIDFDFIKGFVSGMLSAITNKTYYVVKIKKEFINNSFSLILNTKRKQ